MKNNFESYNSQVVLENSNNRSNVLKEDFSDLEKKEKIIATCKKQINSLNLRLERLNISDRNEFLGSIMEALLASKNFAYESSFSLAEKQDWKDNLRGLFENESDFKEWEEEIYWRGDDPAKLYSSIMADIPIKLSSNYFNIASNPDISIAYSGRDEDNPNKFNLAVGFIPKNGQFNLDISTETNLKAIYDAQQGMAKYEGEINPDDIKYIMVRAHGEKPGQVGKTFLFSRVPLNRKRP